MSLEIHTARLRLVPCPSGHPDEIEAALAIELPDDWPDAELAGFLPLYDRWLRDDPSVLGWGVWLFLAGDELVANGGFVGKPDADGKVEIGYGTLPDHRRKGYATEAMQALVDWALAHSEVRNVVAKCDRDNVASIRVLEKLGLARSAEENDKLRWELDPGKPRSSPGPRSVEESR